MVISEAILGERLRSMRKHLGVLQTDIAKNIGVHQNVISRLESGKGGSIENLLMLTNYFSEFFYLDKLFSENFVIMELSNLSEKEMMESIAIEKLKQFKEAFDEEINAIVDLLRR